MVPSTILCCLVAEDSIRFIPPNSKSFCEETRKSTNAASAAGSRHCRISEQRFRSGHSVPFYTMPQTVQAARQLFLQPGSPGDAGGVARRHALTEKFQQRELRELDGALVIFLAALVAHGQLLARQDAVLRIV